MSDENSIIGLWFENQKNKEKHIPSRITNNSVIPVNEKATNWLDNYFLKNNPSPSDLPLSPIGGTFKKCVWDILVEIPYGTLTTYGAISKEVAKRLCKTKMSAQAVGGAISHNPISIIIPCHRVIGANGNLTGYAGGINNKIKLLNIEGIDTTKLLLPKKPLR